MTGARAGLKNVMERLQALYGGAFRFDIENSATGGTIAALSFPFETVRAEPVEAPNRAQGRPFDTFSQAEAAAGSREHGPHQDDHR